MVVHVCAAEEAEFGGKHGFKSCSAIATWCYFTGCKIATSWCLSHVKSWKGHHAADESLARLVFEFVIDLAAGFRSGERRNLVLLPK